MRTQRRSSRRRPGACRSRWRASAPCRTRPARPRRSSAPASGNPRAVSPALHRNSRCPFGVPCGSANAWPISTPMRARVRVVPVARVHLVAERMTPAHVLVLAIDLARALQEGVASQARRMLAQREQLPDERGEPDCGASARLPVDPADLVVLAVRIVVAALRAAELVARLQHRHALRHQQRREHVADLALAQLGHRADRRSDLRRRSSSSGCGCGRRGCLRDSLRCASRSYAVASYSVKPSWQAT